jgi:hypothetical protein
MSNLGFYRLDILEFFVHTRRLRRHPRQRGIVYYFFGGGGTVGDGGGLYFKF